MSRFISDSERTIVTSGEGDPVPILLSFLRGTELLASDLVLCIVKPGIKTSEGLVFIVSSNVNLSSPRLRSRVKNNRVGLVESGIKVRTGIGTVST